MIVFKSFDEIREYILRKTKIAVGFAQRKAFTEFNRFVFKYYGEWKPEVYERTRQLLRALSKTAVYETKNGFSADIFYDVNKMDYSYKNLHKKQENGLWVHPYIPSVHSSDGRFINHGDANLVLEAAAHGSHGGYRPGTAIWDKPISILKAGYKTIFKQAFEEAGLHVK